MYWEIGFFIPCSQITLSLRSWHNHEYSSVDKHEIDRGTFSELVWTTNNSDADEWSSLACVDSWSGSKTETAPWKSICSSCLIRAAEYWKQCAENSPNTLPARIPESRLFGRWLCPQMRLSCWCWHESRDSWVAVYRPRTTQHHKPVQRMKEKLWRQVDRSKSNLSLAGNPVKNLFLRQKPYFRKERRNVMNLWAILSLQKRSNRILKQYNCKQTRS